MTQFRVIDGKTRPMGEGGISSSIIGAPSRETYTGAIPKAAPLGATGGIFSPKHNLNRLLSAASNAKVKAKEQVEEGISAQKAKDSSYIIEETESLRKARLEEQKDRLARLETAKKNATKDEKKEIDQTLKQEEDIHWKTQNFSVGNSIEALKFQAALKGDRDAAAILEAIAKHDWNKARKLSQKRDEKINRAFALKSKLESEEGQNILRSIGFRQNPQGQFIPTDKTPAIATEYDVALTPEELTYLQNTPVAPPPKISPQEVNMLSESEEGRRRLREWGYAKPTSGTYLEAGNVKEAKPEGVFVSTIGATGNILRNK